MDATIELAWTDGTGFSIEYLLSELVYNQTVDIFLPCEDVDKVFAYVKIYNT